MIFCKFKNREVASYKAWPCIRYKARGGLVSETRLWPYNRGNTVAVDTNPTYYVDKGFDFDCFLFNLQDKDSGCSTRFTREQE